MKKWKGIIISAVLFLIIAQVVHSMGSMIMMDYYTNPDYFCLWSEIMMPNAGPPGAEFMIFSIIFNFITALIFAWFYTVIGKSVPGKTNMAKGTHYGLMLFLVASIPGFLSMVLLLAIPVALSIAWVAEALVIYVIGGIVIARFNR